MKIRPAIACAAFVVATVLSAANTPPDRIEATLEQLNQLLDRHRKAEPLPAKPANPFAFGAISAPALPANPTTPITTPIATSALSGDEQILAYCIARLRISGQVQRAGVRHVMINTATYREGDLVPVAGAGDTVYYVRVVRVEPGVVEFAYNEATVTVPIRG
jgi:hypothetical protein